MPKDGKEGFMQRLLHGRKGMTLRNIKFCRGDKDVISGEEFREQLCNIADQRNDGRVDGSQTPTRSDLQPIDVRKFVADM
jgi:hypothetical protein